jgi:hypothetical protein
MPLIAGSKKALIIFICGARIGLFRLLRALLLYLWLVLGPTSAESLRHDVRVEGHFLLYLLS